MGRDSFGIGFFSVFQSGTLLSGRKWQQSSSMEMLTGGDATRSGEKQKELLQRSDVGDDGTARFTELEQVGVG